MNPKSHKEFKNGISEEVGVNPSVVDDFISFYYAKVRENLSVLSFPRINVEGLGVCEIDSFRYYKLIKVKAQKICTVSVFGQ